ncbi:MAG: hypothetical protein R3A80_10330 [Bdellovibrionota bacterium]
MKITKAFLLFFFITAGLSLKAQNRQKEMLNLGYVWNPNGYFSALDAKAAYQFFKYPSGAWSASLSVREADLELNKVNSSLHLKNYRLSLPFVSRLSPAWMSIVSPSVSVRNSSHSMVIEDQSLFYSGFLLATYREPRPDTKWSWSIGAIYSREIEKNFFLPIVSANYMSPPIRLNLGFPNLSLLYQVKPSWEIGLKVNYDSSTYALSDSEPIGKSLYPGFRLRIIDIGPAFNFRVDKHIWVNTNLGVVALAEGQTVSARGSSKDLVYRGDNSIFMRVSLSYYPVLQ